MRLLEIFQDVLAIVIGHIYVTLAMNLKIMYKLRTVLALPRLTIARNIITLLAQNVAAQIALQKLTPIFKQ